MYWLSACFERSLTVSSWMLFYRETVIAAGEATPTARGRTWSWRRGGRRRRGGRAGGCVEEEERLPRGPPRTEGTWFLWWSPEEEGGGQPRRRRRRGGHLESHKTPILLRRAWSQRSRRSLGLEQQCLQQGALNLPLTSPSPPPSPPPPPLGPLTSFLLLPLFLTGSLQDSHHQAPPGTSTPDTCFHPWKHVAWLRFRYEVQQRWILQCCLCYASFF